MRREVTHFRRSFLALEEDSGDVLGYYKPSSELGESDVGFNRSRARAWVRAHARASWGCAGSDYGLANVPEIQVAPIIPRPCKCSVYYLVNRNYYLDKFIFRPVVFSPHQTWEGEV
jgi:hypothetical protein